MEQRVLGRTGRPVSVIGLGTWQLGADWGNVSEADAMEVLRAAVESGVTFFDTADVYGDGRSERVIGRFLAGNAGQGIMVATKMGRRVEQRPEHYTLENFRAWTDRSRINLGTDRLDLVQLQRDTTFAADDHRSYNAHGEAFDVGETFSGVGLEAGADAAAEFAALVNSGTGGLHGGTPAQWALRWVIQQPGVTTVIPGARSTSQARQNAEAASLRPIPQDELGAIEGLYDKYFRATVHDRW